MQLTPPYYECPLYNYLLQTCTCDLTLTSFIQQRKCKQWISTFLQSQPNYFEKKYELVKLILNHEMVLQSVVEYIPTSFRDKNGESLLDIASVSWNNAFDILARYDFEPTEHIWHRLYDMSSSGRFITNILCHICALPHCPKLPSNVRLLFSKLYTSLEEHISTEMPMGNNHRTLMNNIRYVLNREKYI